MSRGAVNEIIPGRLYQRGQIFTWQRPQKIELLRRYNIDIIVNLWPKVDADWWGTEPAIFIQVPAEPSSKVLDWPCRTAAKTVAKMLMWEGMARSALVLCEAGKTRSVFFCAMVYAHFYGATGLRAMEHVQGIVQGASLKPDMKRFLEVFE